MFILREGGVIYFRGWGLNEIRTYFLSNIINSSSVNLALLI